MVSGMEARTGSPDRRLWEKMAPLARPALQAAAMFSFAFNLLLLVSPLYMLQVYDRVLTSGSLDTLLLLTLLALALLMVFAAADSGRRRVLGLLGRELGADLEARVYRATMNARAGAGRPLDAVVTDLAKIERVVSGGTVQPLFDAPFVPMFLLLVFLVHPLLGFVTLAGAAALVVLAIVAERAATASVGGTSQTERAAQLFLAGIARQAGVIRSLGMTVTAGQRWRQLRSDAAAVSLESGRVSNFYGGISKSARQMLQILILGLAAWLVLRQEISSGAIIAASILSGRVLAPIDQAIGAWKPLVEARKGWTAVAAHIAEAGDDLPATVPLPRPVAKLQMTALHIEHPSTGDALFEPFNLALTAGEVLLVVGRSGAGKSTLLKVLAAAEQPASGTATLGAVDLHRWAADDRGRHIGFLPQSVDLLPGTVAQNIVRFTDCDAAAAVLAAQAIDAHEEMLALSQGYDTMIGANAALSAGQRQTIGLARAAFGDPVLLVLDEPSAHLDGRGVEALLAYLATCRKDGRIAVIASHDRRLLAAATLVLDIRDRRVTLTGIDDYVRALVKALPATTRNQVKAS